MNEYVLPILFSMCLLLVVGGGIHAIKDDRHFKRYVRRRILELLSEDGKSVDDIHASDPRISRHPGPIWRYLGWMQQEKLVFYEPVPVRRPNEQWQGDIRTIWRISEIGRIELLRFTSPELN